jgi:hypothetical protein
VPTATPLTDRVRVATRGGAIAAARILVMVGDADSINDMDLPCRATSIRTLGRGNPRTDHRPNLIIDLKGLTGDNRRGSRDRSTGHPYSGRSPAQRIQAQRKISSISSVIGGWRARNCRGWSRQ